MSTQVAPQTRITDERITVQATPEQIWSALTIAEELTRWFPLEAGDNGDGTAWMAWRDQFRFSGRVEASEPQRYLRTVPVFPPGMDPPVKMATEFFIEAEQGGATCVRVVQSGFLADARWDEEYDGTRRGWMFQLRSLKHYLEHHRGSPRHVAWARRLITVPQAEAWRRVTEALGVAGALATAREGDAIRFTSAAGDTFQCTLLTVNPPQDFCGTVANWNNALLRVQFDRLPMRGYDDAQLWLSCYGLPAAKVQALEARWTGILNDLFV